MTNDYESAIEEIREGRRLMSEQCGHDPAKFIAYLKTFNDKYAIQIERFRKEHPALPVEHAIVSD